MRFFLFVDQEVDIVSEFVDKLKVDHHDQEQSYDENSEGILIIIVSILHFNLYDVMFELTNYIQRYT